MFGHPIIYYKNIEQKDANELDDLLLLVGNTCMMQI